MTDKFILVEHKERTQWQKRLDEALEAPAKEYIINPSVKRKPIDPWESIPYVKPDN